jgi:hypothetical protein
MPSLLVSAHEDTQAHTHIEACRKTAHVESLVRNTNYLLHFSSISVGERFFSAFSCEGSTYSIITDRETRAEPSNRDRHDGMRSCQGARRGGGNVCSGLENVMIDGMMCFDDETTCRMVTFGIDGICNSLLKLQAFLLDGM